MEARGNQDEVNIVTFLAGETKAAIIDPYLQKRSESGLLAKRDPKLMVAVNGHNGPLEGKQKSWQEITPFETAVKAGQVIAKRILSEDSSNKIGASQADRSLIDYLSDYGEGSYLSMQSMGETEDFKAAYTHRRPRIIGMLKTAEEEFIKTNGQPQNESDWQNYYEKLFGFFDTKLIDEKSNSEAIWVKTYLVYYLTAWNYGFIDAFEKPNESSPQENKFRGLVGFVLSMDKEKKSGLLDRMSKLDKSTKMSLEGGRSITFELRRAVGNLETYKIINKVE